MLVRPIFLVMHSVFTRDLSGYYGYTYSLVFAADMYATVFKADPLDPAPGQRYRKNILYPGGSQDDIESLKARAHTV